MRKLYDNKYRIASARLPHWDYAADGTYFITICTHNRVHHFGSCTHGQMRLSTIGALVQGFWYEIPKHFPFVRLGEFQVMPNHIHGILSVHKKALDFETMEQQQEQEDVVPPVETLQCNVSVPNTSVPNTSVPNVSVPNTSVPNTSVPNTSVPNTSVPYFSVVHNDGERSAMVGEALQPERLQPEALQPETLQPETLQPETLQCNVSTGDGGKFDLFSKISPKAGSVSTIIRSYKAICSKHINKAFPDIGFEWQERFWDNIVTNGKSFETISDYIITNPQKWEEDKFFDP